MAEAVPMISVTGCGAVGIDTVNAVMYSVFINSLMQGIFVEAS